MKYRPDIDGLRALAVLPVVLYHASIPGVSGGYVGVDVFFVISGFLITSIVAEEIVNDRFSLINFYERRARRILPALVAVIVTTLVAGWFLLLPSEFENLGESAFASALFVSNLYFALTLDYFSQSAEFAPLLHTWSLAVEEQFYLFFPPLLILLFACRGRVAVGWAIISLSILSFVAAIIALPYRPDPVFFIIFFRAWELGLGAVLALMRMAFPSSGVLREAVGFGGLLLILAPVFVYTSGTPFPGLAALPPALGAAALIYIGAQDGGSWVNRVLSNRALVWGGLISYSLYLWHWPILAFLRVALGTTKLPFSLGVGAVFASIAVASLSLRFIERPFRARPAKGPTRQMVFASSAIAMSGVLLAGGVLKAVGGFPGRISEQGAAVAEVGQDRNTLRDKCFGDIPSDGLCQIGAHTEDAEDIEFLFWGDSHANAMAPGIDQAASDAGQRGLFAAKGACPPIQEIRRNPELMSCTAFIEGVWKILEARSDIGLVILAARWPLSVEGTRYPVEGDGDVVLAWAGEPDRSPNQADNPTLFEAGLRETVEAIRSSGRLVALLGSIPEVPWNVPASIARSELLGMNSNKYKSFSASIFFDRNGRTEAILQRVAAQYEGVLYLPIADLFCDDSACRVTDSSGRPLYIDDDHVSRATALDVLSPRFAKIFATKKSSAAISGKD